MKRHRAIITTALLLVTLYVLGLGPVAWLEYTGYLSVPLDTIADVLYTPLDWIAEIHPALQDLRDRYVVWWTPL